MLNKELIADRIKNFWGYGSLDAPVWFVGMEEGLNPTTDTEELETRFKAAYGKATVDMRRDMGHLVGHMKWFVPGAPIQGTWKYPIGLSLYLKNHRIPSKEEIREHQSSVLGDSVRCESSTIELMSLPSQKADQSTWLYGSSGVPGCETRASYLERYLPQRVVGLKQLLQKHRPKLVIFYSVSYLAFWKEIIGAEPQQVTRRTMFAKVGDTVFCVIPNGGQSGLSYSELYEFAEKIRDFVVF